MNTARLSVFSVPGMDCPNEAGMVRLTLGEAPTVQNVEIDLTLRRVSITHGGEVEEVKARLAQLGFGADLLSVSEVERPVTTTKASDLAGQRQILKAVLFINAAMFVIELLAGLLSDSAGLLADSLDMLADALVYAVGLRVVGRALGAQHRAARLAGLLQLVMGLGVLFEVGRRALVGSDPISTFMMVTATCALLANLVCAKLLHQHRDGGAHMQASWIFTATDAVANLGVILAGLLVFLTGSGLPDLVIGGLISGVVLYGAARIIRLSKGGSTEAT